MNCLYSGGLGGRDSVKSPECMRRSPGGSSPRPSCDEWVSDMKTILIGLIGVLLLVDMLLTEKRWSTLVFRKPVFCKPLFKLENKYNCVFIVVSFHENIVSSLLMQSTMSICSKKTSCELHIESYYL